MKVKVQGVKLKLLMLIIIDKCNYAKMYTYSERYIWNTASTAKCSENKKEKLNKSIKKLLMFTLCYQHERLNHRLF